MKIAIVNYGMGNIGSVANAVESFGYKSFVCNSPSDLKRATHIILPGVGAFQKAMNTLRSGGWVAELEQEVQIRKKPFLGICLGMQLLATTGEEYGTTEGLNWIGGRVTRLRTGRENLPVPHVGWNTVAVTKPSRLFGNLKKALSFYFVHSFHFAPSEDSVVSSTCNYGTDFISSIEKDNIVATQFHPEKSQAIGLKILSNFLKI